MNKIESFPWHLNVLSFFCLSMTLSTFTWIIMQFQLTCCRTDDEDETASDNLMMMSDDVSWACFRCEMCYCFFYFDFVKQMMVWQLICIIMMLCVESSKSETDIQSTECVESRSDVLLSLQWEIHIIYKMPLFQFQSNTICILYMFCLPVVDFNLIFINNNYKSPACCYNRINDNNFFYYYLLLSYRCLVFIVDLHNLHNPRIKIKQIIVSDIAAIRA